LRVSSLVIAILIFLSTLFTKQHVFIDIPAGILLAEGTYILSGRWQKFTGFVEKIFTNINKRVFKDL
jgi:membrane-associated phospholipid phosphatase